MHIKYEINVMPMWHAALPVVHNIQITLYYHHFITAAFHPLLSSFCILHSVFQLSTFHAAFIPGWLRAATLKPQA